MTHTQNFESGNANPLKSFRQAVSLAGRSCSCFSELKIACTGGVRELDFGLCCAWSRRTPRQHCLELMPVILYTRRGNDWIDRYPLMVEAALHNLSSSFVIDGEGALLRCVKKSREQSTGKCVTDKVMRCTLRHLVAAPAHLRPQRRLGSRWHSKVRRLFLNPGDMLKAKCRLSWLPVQLPPCLVASRASALRAAAALKLFGAQRPKPSPQTRDPISIDREMKKRLSAKSSQLKRT